MGFLDKLFGQEKEVTPGGSPIYRYDTPEDCGLRTPKESGVYAPEVEARFEELFPGRESRVLHEIVSDLVHIDVHVMWPTQEQKLFCSLHHRHERPAHDPRSEYPREGPPGPGSGGAFSLPPRKLAP